MNTYLICFGVISILVDPILSSKTSDNDFIHQYAPFFIIPSILIIIPVIVLVTIMIIRDSRTPSTKGRTSSRTSGRNISDEERGSVSQQVSVSSSHRQNSVRSHGDTKSSPIKEHPSSRSSVRSRGYSPSLEHQAPKQRRFRRIFHKCCPWGTKLSARQSIVTMPSFETLNNDYEYVVEKLAIRKVPLSLSGITEDIEEKYGDRSIHNEYSEENMIKQQQTIDVPKEGGESLTSDIPGSKIGEKKSQDILSSFYAMVPPGASASGRSDASVRPDTEFENTTFRDKTRKDTEDTDDRNTNPMLSDNKIALSSHFAMIPEHPGEHAEKREDVNVFASTSGATYLHSQHSIPFEKFAKVKEIVDTDTVTTDQNLPLSTQPSNKSLNITNEADVLQEEEKEIYERSQDPTEPVFVKLSKDKDKVDKETYRFLNQFSSIFVDNLKDPIPKDPLSMPNEERNKQSHELENEATQEQLLHPRKSEPINTTSISESISYIASNQMPSITRKLSDSSLGIVSSAHSTKSETGRTHFVTEEDASLEQVCLQLKSPPLASTSGLISGSQRPRKLSDVAEIVPKIQSEPPVSPKSHPSTYNEHKHIFGAEPSKEIGCESLTPPKHPDTVISFVQDRPSLLPSRNVVPEPREEPPPLKQDCPPSVGGRQDRSGVDSADPLRGESKLVQRNTLSTLVPSRVDDKQSKPVVENPHLIESYHAGYPPPTQFAEVERSNAPQKQNIDRSPGLSPRNDMSDASGYQIVESPTRGNSPEVERGATLRWKIIIKHHRDNADDQPPSKKSKGLPSIKDG